MLMPGITKSDSGSSLNTDAEKNIPSSDSNVATRIGTGLSDAEPSSGTVGMGYDTSDPSEEKEAYILKELEKIDKEARVARRAFEQRIQKHKIIQVTFAYCKTLVSVG
jgi:hypothetical protein